METTPVATRHLPGDRAARLAIGSAAAYLVALGLYARLLDQQGGGESPGQVLRIQLLIGGLALSALVAAFIPTRRLRLVLLAASAVSGWLLGLLAMFSIGLLVVVAAALASGALGVSLAQAGWGAGKPTRALATAGGATLGIVALAAVFVPSMSPSVTCQPGGASFSSGWSLSGGNSGGGSMSGNADGRTVTGTEFANGHTYRFTCRDGRLVEFKQVGGWTYK